MPRGRHAVQSALVRLRRELGVDEIAPAHWLDRLTAGCCCSRCARRCGPATSRFAERRAIKEYRALAPVRPELAGTVTVRNRIEKTAGDLRALVVDGEINAVSDITLIDARIGLYRLVPHQAHPSAAPAHGIARRAHRRRPCTRTSAPTWPRFRRRDFTRPLRLLASSLAFDDPMTGERREFVSRMSLGFHEYLRVLRTPSGPGLVRRSCSSTTSPTRVSQISVTCRRRYCVTTGASAPVCGRSASGARVTPRQEAPLSSSR